MSNGKIKKHSHKLQKKEKKNKIKNINLSYIIQMALNEKFKSIKQEDKKIILYKITEIYSDNDELLKFMDELDKDNIDFVFDIVFAWNTENRDRIRENENKDFQKLIWKISELSIKVNKLIIEWKEFLSDEKDDNDLKKLEEIF